MSGRRSRYTADQKVTITVKGPKWLIQKDYTDTVFVHQTWNMYFRDVMKLNIPPNGGLFVCSRTYCITRPREGQGHRCELYEPIFKFIDLFSRRSDKYLVRICQTKPYFRTITEPLPVAPHRHHLPTRMHWQNVSRNREGIKESSSVPQAGKQSNLVESCTKTLYENFSPAPVRTPQHHPAIPVIRPCSIRLMRLSSSDQLYSQKKPAIVKQEEVCDGANQCVNEASREESFVNDLCNISFGEGAEQGQEEGQQEMEVDEDNTEQSDREVDEWAEEEWIGQGWPEKDDVTSNVTGIQEIEAELRIDGIPVDDIKEMLTARFERSFRNDQLLRVRNEIWEAKKNEKFYRWALRAPLACCLLDQLFK